MMTYDKEEDDDELKDLDKCDIVTMSDKNNESICDKVEVGDDSCRSNTDSHHIPPDSHHIPPDSHHIPPKLPPKPQCRSLYSSTATTTTTTTPPLTAIASAIKRNSSESIPMTDSVIIPILDRPMKDHHGNPQLGDDNLYGNLDDGGRFLSIAMPLEEDDTENDSNTKDKGRKSIIRKSKKFVYKTLFGEEQTLTIKSDDDNDESLSSQTMDMEYVKQRKLLPYAIKSHPEMHNYFLAVVNLKQPNLGPKRYSPQGNRDSMMPVLVSSSLGICTAAAENLSPPLWASDSDQHCTICKYSFALLRVGHHCRNCGYLVCTNCSFKNWPSDSLPKTYHFNEKFCRICDNCNFLTDAFYDSLRYGDEKLAMAIYRTGNINLQVPAAQYSTCDYPLHACAEGGNLKLFKWLVEEKFCPLYSNDYNNVEETPLLNLLGESCLAIATKYGNIDIMKYLIQEKGCVVTEISSLNVALRGLYCLLDSRGPVPIITTDGLDHFRDETNTVHRESSYAVAIDSSNNTFRNLPNAVSTNYESILWSKTDRRPPLKKNCKGRKEISERAYRQCLNTVRNNINLFETNNDRQCQDTVRNNINLFETSDVYNI